jgi:uncharacterized protein
VPTAITEFVLNHPLFCHHNHHFDFRDFEAQRSAHGFRSLLSYAEADLVTAAGPRGDGWNGEPERLAELWPKVRTTGYGRAVSLGCRALFGLEYEAANFGRITEALQSAFADRSPLEVYEYFLREKANTKWVVKDHHRSSEGEVATGEALYPDYYRFTWRADGLFSIVDDGPIQDMEHGSGQTILALEQLVAAVHASIDSYRASAPFAAIKVGMAYQRDLNVTLTTRHEAEVAFDRIRTPSAFRHGLQQSHGAVNAAEGRALSDYLFHAVMAHAQDEDLPVQIHTGYLAGNWGSLNGAKASYLIPVFDRYRRVRFDIFHGSWPWVSELGAIAKNCPNVYPDLCWAWTMNPTESERALSEWLDAVPFNKIFGYGADTGWPWCDVGYALQARIGIARVLEQKVEAGYFSPATAQEVASALLLRNGEEFYGLSA